MILTCVHCNKEVTIPVTPDQIEDWLGGTLIQEAIPNLDTEQREMLITRICNECWETLIPPDSEADNDI